MNAYFVPSLCGFIDARFKDDGSYPAWPQDATLITGAEASEYQGKAAPAGKMLGAVAGRPAWVDLPAPTKAEAVSAAAGQKQRLTESAMQSVAVLQLKLQAGRKLSAAESQRLNAVLDFIDCVSEISEADAPDISWPVMPE